PDSKSIQLPFRATSPRWRMTRYLFPSGDSNTGSLPYSFRTLVASMESMTVNGRILFPAMTEGFSVLAALRLVRQQARTIPATQLASGAILGACHGACHAALLAI